MTDITGFGLAGHLNAFFDMTKEFGLELQAIGQLQKQNGNALIEIME